MMPLNLDKFHILHVGTVNRTKTILYLVRKCPVLMDRGVVITSDLKCITVYNSRAKGAKDSGLHEAGLSHRNKQAVLSLYNVYRALVKPLLEYGTQFPDQTNRCGASREVASPSYHMLAPSIRHKGYHRRLADLKLFTLEQRRL